MPPFTVNPHRLDPYKNFKFRVSWDGRTVAGVSKVGPLRRVTEVVTHRDGGDLSHSRKSPGAVRYEPVLMERGVTHDTAFAAWANKSCNFVQTKGAEVSLKDFRKDVQIELLNEAGQVVLAYRLQRCWVSQYQALPELDAATGAVAIESIVVEFEGWERDPEVAEPAETSYGQ